MRQEDRRSGRRISKGALPAIAACSQRAGPLSQQAFDTVAEMDGTIKAGKNMLQENNTNLRKDAPIGVFDSGVGGLTVAREIMRQMPNEKIIYFGDRKKHWTEDSIIFAGNKDYVKFRRCINMIDDSVICLFPFVTKESINNDIEKKAN